MKEVVMDARFEDNTANIKHVSEIMKKENPIFLYFSKMYLEMLENGVDDFYDHTDCMNIGRLVMKSCMKWLEWRSQITFLIRQLRKLLMEMGSIGYP